LLAHLLAEEFNDLDSLGGTGSPFDAGIEVFHVFPEDDHIDFLRLPQGTGDSREVLDGPDTGVEVELLADGHVEAAHPSPDRGSQRSLDPDAVLLEVLQRFVREPLACLGVAFLSGENFEPVNGPFPAVGFLYRRIEHRDRSLPDVRANAVPFDEGNDDLIGYDQAVVRAQLNDSRCGCHLMISLSIIFLYCT
jgi:hypothetical protein